MNDVALIIVTWNSASDILRCLKSIAGVSGSRTARVLVIDNASTDGTPDLVCAEHPEVAVTRNRENTGFAAANNQGIRASDARYVMLLNPDTAVDAGTIEALVAYMDAHPTASAAGPMILNADRSVQRIGVRFPSRWNLLVESLFLDRLFPRTKLFGAHIEAYADPGIPRVVDYLQGSALMVRRTVIDAIGGLDEGFFMYFEEADWCYRMKQNGGEIHYAPVGKVIHFGGDTFGHFDERRLLHYHRSMLRFFRKHYGFWKTIGLRPILVLRSLLRILLWCAIAAGSSSHRRHARSSALGYCRVLGILMGRP